MFADILIRVVLAFIMFSIGLSISPGQFKNVLTHPKSMIAGLFSQIIILPLITFVLLSFTKLDPALKIGFIILSTCPGGSTSGFITYFFKGNVALSVWFTSINSFITLLSIPFINNLALSHFLGSASQIHLPLINTAVEIFCITLIPALLGSYINYKKLLFVDRIQKHLKYLLILLLGLVFVLKFFATEKNGGAELNSSEIISILPIALFLNIIFFSWGYLSSIGMKLNKQNALTIAIEAAVHNTTLAFLVGGTLLKNQNFTKPALIYAMFSFWTTLIFCYTIKRSNKLKTMQEFI